MSSTIPMLPNYTPKAVSVYPNEYITNITVNRGNLRLLENDIFLYRLLRDIEEGISSISVSSTDAGLSAWTLLSGSSGNWDDTYSIVSAMSADWTLHDSDQDTTTLSELYKAALGAGSYNHIPYWNTTSGQWLETGYNVNDKNEWSGTPVDDVSGHSSIPTCRTVYELFKTVSLSGISQLSGADPEDIAIWSSDGLLKSNGQQVNNSAALSGLSGKVPTENIVKDYADAHIASKTFSVSAPTIHGSVPTYNSLSGIVDWKVPVADQSTWQYDQQYAGSLYTAAAGQQNLLDLQWPTAISGITDLWDFPVAMHIVTDCHAIGWRDRGGDGSANEMQSSFRRITLGFFWSGRCYNNSGGATTWAGLGAGTHGWVSRSNPAYDAESSGFETGANIGFGASDWNWLVSPGYPAGGQPGFAAGYYWKYMTAPQLWKKTATTAVNPSLGYFRFSPSSQVNYYWNIKMKVVLQRILGEPGDPTVEPVYPQGSQTVDLTW